GTAGEVVDGSARTRHKPADPLGRARALKSSGCEARMSLTVLHVLVPEPPGEVGGADMHVRDLAVAQLATGMTPAVIERGSKEFPARLASAGIEVISATGLGMRAAVHVLAREIVRKRPDVVHAHGYDADYWAAATRCRFPRLFRHMPLVFTQHGVVDDTLW